MLEAMVDQFNQTFQVENYSSPSVGTVSEQALVLSVIDEELNELDDALRAGDLVEALDAFTDIIYATAQQARKLGMPIDAALREVHRSNMSKLDENGNPRIREDGKILKGSNYSKPDLHTVILEAQLNGEL